MSHQINHPEISRRNFLKAGTLGIGSAGLAFSTLKANQSNPKEDRNCIFLFLVGGPSHLDTWDPKPNAPAEIRGPFRPLRTKVPGIHLSENFPLLAKLTERFSIVRSIYHTAAPIHETGHQLLQTGRLFSLNREYPHYGSVLSHLRGPKGNGMPCSVVIRGPIGNTGVNISHGQGSGFLATEHEPVPIGIQESSCWRVLGGNSPLQQTICQDSVARGEPRTLRERYGRNPFGSSCLLARRLVEGGVRFVTVNMFDSVFDQITWDCHADGGALPTTLDDYKNTLCPMFDRAYSTLLVDLQERGLLENTLVVAMGEFGRTPRVNPKGGRDHWPGVFSGLFAGVGIRGGQVIGESDRRGSEPRSRPVGAPEIAATVYHALNIHPQTCLPTKDGQLVPLVEANPVEELFG